MKNIIGTMYTMYNSVNVGNTHFTVIFGDTCNLLFQTFLHFPYNLKN